MFDIEDPFLHVSDGGHWENLALVEALRDQHERIIVVDAGGGKVEPSSAGPNARGFGALNEAIDLARIELRVEVRIDVSELRPARGPARAQELGCRHGHLARQRLALMGRRACPRGLLLYVKAVVSDRTPEDVLVHANVDRVFPDYSTADQFLSDAEFRSLVRLGQSGIHQALGLERRLNRL